MKYLKVKETNFEQDQLYIESNFPEDNCLYLNKDSNGVIALIMIYFLKNSEVRNVSWYFLQDENTNHKLNLIDSIESNSEVKESALHTDVSEIVKENEKLKQLVESYKSVLKSLL